MIHALSALILLSIASTASAEEKPLPQAWDYVPAMKKIAATGKGKPGVVLHIGDSITYSNPYGQWARNGQGKSDADKAILEWMHSGKDDDTDGWYLARFDHPDGGRSYTACSGIRTEEMLAGGKQKMPPLEQILDKYRPQMVVFMLGTNDATAQRGLAAFRADYLKSVELMLARGIIPIVSTIPPHIHRKELAASYNEAIRDVAKAKGLPLIDYEKEILTRRPEDWNGTLLSKNDVHPSVGFGGSSAAAEPTAENLKNSGYLLRGWLSVKKIAEVKASVLDGSPKASPAPKIPLPGGKPVRLPVTRDNWFSNVGPEADGNNGGATRLKIKSYQEMSIFDIDPKILKGRAILGGTLHIKTASDQPIRRATVSGVGAEWVEGTATNYAPQKGSSTFKHRQHPDVPWTIPGSDLCSVILGQGGTLWRMADAFPPDEQGWQKLAIDPTVLKARAAGISHGFLLFDDTGSEWTRQGEKFSLAHFPNRFFHSRESGEKNSPYVVVYLGDTDETAPAQPTEIRSQTGDLAGGEAIVSWKTPDDAGSGTIGFFIDADSVPVPRYLIPVAGKPGERVSMHLRDMNLKPGSKVNIAVRAVDGAGNIGPAASAMIETANPSFRTLPPATVKAFHEVGPLPKLADAEVAILDELDKVDPVRGAMIPKQLDGYLVANHLWSAKENRIRLQAGKNEFIAFQILLRGSLTSVQPSVKFKDAPGIAAAFGEYRNVPTSKGPLPDPIVSLRGPFRTPVEGQKSGSLHCELYVPHDVQAGEYRGLLLLQQDDAKLEIPIVLDVWDFTLPDHLSFLPEMNGYGLPGPEAGYYRLGHRHRTVVNIVPYSQSGQVAEGWGPTLRGKQLDWTAFDKRFGPYFDGTAFADLPRKGVPIDAFYLPLHENWPTPIEGNYNGDYWADRAFPARYRQAFVETARGFAQHFNEKKWNDTLFQGFLNNKQDFKKNGWSRASAPWILDEPANFQDFWALRYFARAFHEGVRQAPGSANLVFRADVSRPMWQRDSLDGLLEYLVVNGDFRKYHRMVMDRKSGQTMLEYGNSNAVEDANLQPVGWCIDSWCLGANGVVPWLTIGNQDAWKKGESTCLFYPARTQGETEPTPSIRLKAYRRGQQDVEYLTLYALTMREPTWAVGQQVRRILKLAAERQGTGFTGAEDAGILSYGRLLPQDVWALRMRIGESLSQAKPPARRQLVHFIQPRGDVSSPERYVSVGEVP